MQRCQALLESEVLHVLVEQQDRVLLLLSETRCVAVSWGKPQQSKRETHNEGSEFPAKLKQWVNIDV